MKSVSIMCSVSQTVDVDVDLSELLRDLSDEELAALNLRTRYAPERFNPALLERLRIHARHGDLDAFLDCVEALADAFDVILDTSRLRPAMRRIAA